MILLESYTRCEDMSHHFWDVRFVFSAAHSSKEVDDDPKASSGDFRVVSPLIAMKVHEPNHQDQCLS